MSNPSTTVVGRTVSPPRTPDAQRKYGLHAAATSDVLELLSRVLEPQRRIVHAGQLIFRTGDEFHSLHIMNTGFVKVVKPAADGREQLVGLKFRGDWMGFDGIADGFHGCDAVAMDTGEIWSVRYDAFMAACALQPRLYGNLVEAMSRELGHDRQSLMAICTLPADARVANFLHDWTDSAGKRGLRTDQITLRLSRAEIGNYLGLTLESVSRAFSKLARTKVIGFVDKGRRDVRIPDIQALAAFVQQALSPELVPLH